MWASWPAKNSRITCPPFISTLSFSLPSLGWGERIGKVEKPSTIIRKFSELTSVVTVEVIWVIKCDQFSNFFQEIINRFFKSFIFQNKMIKMASKTQCTVVVIGDTRTGKTALIQRLLNDKYLEVRFNILTSNFFISFYRQANKFSLHINLFISELLFFFLFFWFLRK